MHLKGYKLNWNMECKQNGAERRRERARREPMKSTLQFNLLYLITIGFQ